ncbi:MAG: hypothetical protein RR285_00150 [Acinetobacter sp.]
MDVDEFSPPTAEIYELVNSRLVHRPRCLGSGKHQELMRKLYAEYADSMGRLTIQRVGIIVDEWDPKWDNELDQVIKKAKNEELRNTTSRTQHTVKRATDQESLPVQRNAQRVRR